MRATAVARPLVRGPSLTRTGLVLGGGGLLLVVVLLAGVGLGSVGVAPDDTVAILAHRLLGLGSTPTWKPMGQDRDRT